MYVNLRKNQAGYPLVNVYITMDNHHFQWVNPLFLWPFSSSQTVSHYQGITISYRLSYYIPWFHNDFPWHTVSHNQRLQRLDGWWVLDSWPMANGLAAALCRRPESTILSTRSESESGYYLVTTWLFHLFPSDVYRKIFGLLTVKPICVQFQTMAPQIWSAPRLNRKYTWLSLPNLQPVCVFSTSLNSTICRVPGNYIVETRWNSWRFGDVSSRYSSSPRIAVTPRKKNLHRPGV